MNYIKLIGIFGITAILFGCGESTDAPVKLDPIKGDIAKGAEIFKTNCTACHQQDGKGKAGFAPSINNIDFLAIADDHLVKRFILEGRPGTAMMAYKNNPAVADNVNDLVAYIRTWSEGFALYEELPLNREWKSGGDAGNGETLFANYCASCHGENGQGYSAGGSGTGIGNAAFLAIAPDDYIKQTILNGRAGTAMKSFDGAKGVAHLTDSDMDDVISFLRTKGEYVAASTVVEKAEGEVVTPSEDATSGLFSNALYATVSGLVLLVGVLLLMMFSVLGKLKQSLAI